MESCVIEGTLLSLEDDFLIGQTKTITTNLPVILVSKIHKSKPVFKTNEELINKVAQLNLKGDNFFKCLFTNKGYVYRQPDYFEHLISAFLLSSSQEYPIHLLLMAKEGTGKSTIQECIHERFDEDTQILEGSASTIKSLVPSFKGNLPDAGLLLKSNRICVLDELFRILIRVDKEDRDIVLSSMNPILEHKKNRTAGSGNGNLKFNPTARVFASTNPIFGGRTMSKLCDKFDNSFLSRWFIWYQDDKHIQYVQANESILPSTVSISKDEFVGILDYLHSFKSDYDAARVLKIFNAGLLMLGTNSEENEFNNVRSIYSARYKHHIKCLMDGLVKTRCLIEGDATFTAKEADYKKLELIWNRMLIGWGILYNDVTKASVNAVFNQTEDVL